VDSNISESNNNNDIYINNKENIIENKLIIYLEKKQADKKISLLFISLYFSNIFLIFFNQKILIYI
jgi:hypothetical protein